MPNLLIRGSMAQNPMVIPTSSDNMKLNRRLVVMAFTDIVAFAALNQLNENQALNILERHERLLRPFFKFSD